MIPLRSHKRVSTDDGNGTIQERKGKSRRFRSRNGRSIQRNGSCPKDGGRRHEEILRPRTSTRRPRNRRQSMARHLRSQDGPTQQKTRLQASRAFRDNRKTWTNGVQAQTPEHVQSTPSIPRRQTNKSQRRRMETSTAQNKAKGPRSRNRRIHKLDGCRPRRDNPDE